MPTDLERLVVQLSADINRYEKALNRAQGLSNTRMRSIERRASQMSKRVEAAYASAGQKLALVFAGAASLRGAQNLIDSSIRITNSLKVAGLQGQALKDVYNQLYASAQKNAAPVEQLVELYTRASLVQKELGVSTQELLTFTDHVSTALRVSGQSAEASRGALLQLGQALSTNVVRAEEYNSLQEGAVPILRAVAAGLKEAGGSVGTLTNLVKSGQVSSQAFFRAFEAGAPVLEDKVASAEFTVSQRLTRLQNVLIDAAGRFNESAEAADTFGSAIDNLANFIQNVDFDNLISGIQSAIDQMNAGIIAANNFADAIAHATGLENVGAAILGHRPDGPLGGYSTKAVQDRVNGAFGAGAPQGTGGLTPEAIVRSVTAAQKSGRIEPVVITPSVKTVSLSDYPIAPKGTGSGGGKRSKRGGGRGSSAFDREVEQIKERTAALNAETAAQASVNPLVDDYGFAVAKAHATQELLNDAQRQGLAITPELKATVDSLATGYANAEVAANKLADSQNKARQNAEQMRDLGRDVLGGFISDLRSGTSAADALSHALDKIVDKLLDSALDGLFGGGSGGGFLGGLFGGSKGGGLLGGAIIPGILHSGGVAGPDGYGHGRSVSPALFAGAPRYHSGGIAGLKPGEIPAILQKGEVVLPRGMKTGQPAATSAHITVNVEGANGDQHVISLVRQGVSQGLSTYDKQLNGSFGARMNRAQQRQI